MNGFLPYLLNRLWLVFTTLLIILFVSYCLLRLAPGDPSKSSILGDETGRGASGLAQDSAALAKDDILREKLYLDKPLPVGFFYWMSGVVRGDFGTSVSVDKGRPVTTLILERLPVTLRLNLIAILLIYLTAIPMGIFAGAAPDSRYDRITTVILFFLYSLPSIWVALILQATLCKGGMIQIFPLKGLSPDVTTGLSTWSIMGRTAMHYILPILCMVYGSFAGLSRFSRSSMLETMHCDYIRTARAKGLPETDVLFSHAFRNTLVIMVTLFSGLLPALVTGSILIEHVFNIPGMGQLSMLAMSSRDIPLMMALFAFSSFLTLGGMLLADILYVFADPRISFRSRI